MILALLPRPAWRRVSGGETVVGQSIDCCACCEPAVVVACNVEDRPLGGENWAAALCSACLASACAAAMALAPGAGVEPPHEGAERPEPHASPAEIADPCAASRSSAETSPAPYKPPGSVE